MTRSAAKLRIVNPELHAQLTDAHEPEDAFPLLFAQQDELLRQAAQVQRAIQRARERYRDKHNLLMLPSIETLRRLFA